MRFDNHESQGEEYNEKIGFLEKELWKVRQEEDVSILICLLLIETYPGAKDCE